MKKIKNTKDTVKTAKMRSHASTLWLNRQINDVYVKQAKSDGYRSRAAYKLVEINEKLDLLRQGMRVADLGAAPGGWSQYCAKQGCKVVAIDLLPIDFIPNVEILQGDFLETELDGMFDLVLSDMAPNTTGAPKLDHLRIMGLTEAAFEFCQKSLKIGGHFIAKIFMGGEEQKMAATLRKHFTTVKFIKPESSRKDSKEVFLVGLSFKG